MKILYGKEGERIHQYKRTLETIEGIVQGLQTSLGLRIVEHEKSGETPISFTEPDVVKVSEIMHSAKDAVHFCMAYHNKLVFVSHETQFGKLKELYPNARISTVKRLLKNL